VFAVPSIVCRRFFHPLLATGPRQQSALPLIFIQFDGIAWDLSLWRLFRTL